jgi:hypothetical protein
MRHQPRDPAADRAAITSAAGRLLAGTPLRSATGQLTQTELICESGLRRDVVYAHPDLIDAFKAGTSAQRAVPATMQAITSERDRLAAQLTTARADLTAARRQAAALRCLAAELSLELDQARDELAAATAVTRLPAAPAPARAAAPPPRRPRTGPHHTAEIRDLSHPAP